MLTPYLPYPLHSGGQIRTYNLLKNLRENHQITLFSLIKNESDRKYIPELEPYCADIQVFKRSSKPFTLRNVLRAGLSLYPFLVTRNLVSETSKAVDKELSTHTYDLIHAETFYMMPNISQRKVPTILVEQTIESLGYQSYAQSSKHLFIKPFLTIDIFKIKYWEKYFWQHADRLITMSQEDKEFIKTQVPEIETIDVVANGVDIEYFDVIKKDLPKLPTVLFVGTFSWLPNVQAVTYLVEEIWPLVRKKMPQAQLQIVGFQPTKTIREYARLDSVSVQGSVKDIRDAYASSHMLLAPVEWGKGTRYKILESMATKTPIVATPVAVEGIHGLESNEHVLLGSSATELADQTLQLLQDKRLQQRLSKNSYQLVKENYNWKVISNELDRIYREIGTK